MFKRIIPVVLIVAICCTGFLAYDNKQEIRDQITVSRSVIEPRVTQLVIDSGMNDRGIFVYHAANPQLENSEVFSQSCKKSEERSAILGCYVYDTIHIYDIDDERLSGVREVTATHEALHAIYNRTSDADRARIARLVEVEYERLLPDNPELLSRMDYYERTQPGQRVNELHSIIGTEFLGISDELEEYYSQYFSDRSKVVALHQQYKHRFDELRGLTSSLRDEIGRMEGQLDAMSQERSSLAAEHQRKVTDFNNRANSGVFGNQEDFDSERRALIQQGSYLTQLSENYFKQYEVYGQMVERYNQTAAESDSLYKALDSTLIPSPRI